MAKAIALVPVLLSLAGVVPGVAPAAEPLGVTVVLDYGVVRAGDVLAPCVRLENRSSHEVRVEHVATSMGGPFVLTLAPGERVVRQLTSIDTRRRLGPMTTTRLLLLTPPGDVAAELLATCTVDGSADEAPSPMAD